MAERQGPPAGGQNPEPVAPQLGMVAPEPGAHELVGPGDLAAAAAPWPQVGDAEVGAAAGEAGQPAAADDGSEVGRQAEGVGQRAEAAAGGAGQPGQGAVGQPAGAAPVEGAVAQPAGAAADCADRALMEDAAAQPAGAAAGCAGQPEPGSARGFEAAPDARARQNGAAGAMPAGRAMVADENAPPFSSVAEWRRSIRLPQPECEVNDIARLRRQRDARGLPMWDTGNFHNVQEMDRLRRRQRALRELPIDQVSLRSGADGQAGERPVGIVRPNVLWQDILNRAGRALQELRDVQRNNMGAVDASLEIARGALDAADDLHDAADDLQEALESVIEASGYPVSNDRENHSDGHGSRVSSIRPNEHVSIGISISQAQSASVADETRTKAGPKGRAMAEYRRRARRQASDLSQEDDE